MGVSMRRWMVAAVAAMAALTALAPATMAQTNLIPGGLTAVPPTALSPNLAQNPGFEANSGGVPAGWTGGGGWALDQQTTHSGSFSYRWSSGPSSDQPIFLKADIDNFSAWITTLRQWQRGPSTAGRLPSRRHRPVVHDRSHPGHRTGRSTRS